IYFSDFSVISIIYFSLIYFSDFSVISIIYFSLIYFSDFSVISIIYFSLIYLSIPFTFQFNNFSHLPFNSIFFFH
ncbi:hypothetical protein M153_34390003, partial [Pseudoloma neurophilia]